MAPLSESAVRQALDAELAGADGDVLAYAAGCLADSDLCWGAEDDGFAGAFDAVGAVLEEACGGGDEAVKALLGRLAAVLHVSAQPQPVAAAPARTTPFVMGALTAAEAGTMLGKVAKGVIVACSDGTELDAAKATKRRTREESKAREAYEKHLEELATAAAGDKATVVRNAGGGGSKDVALENLQISNGGEPLIEDGSLLLAHGRRYGLLGRNGSGKSTLLRAIANRQVAGLHAGIQVLHVEQEVTGDDTTVIESVLAADGERTQLLAEEAKLLSDTGGSAARLSAVYARLNEIDAYGAEARAAAILSGLSFSPEQQKRPTKSVSGGWRMRVALARALFIVPDLLLLDEPTNHLDLSAVLWLESVLVAWPNTLLIVSHAREFLNNVATDIIQLSGKPGKLTAWKGNYDAFCAAAAERDRCSSKRAEAEARKKKHLQAFLDKFGALLRQRAKLVANRIARMEAHVDKVGVFDDPEYSFRFPEPAEVSPPIIGFHDVTFAYPGAAPLFKEANFAFDCDSRVALVGRNGVGKTTLLNLMNGVLVPQAGHVTRNHKVRIASFAQHHVDDMDMELTPVGYMHGCFPGTPMQTLRNHLGSFGISDRLAVQTIFTLSGGQKSRVALAKVTFSNPHILLLDEPSNHLDIESVDALIQGLSLFKGGVLLVSHDEHLITNAADELWTVTDGAVVPYKGSFRDYKASLVGK